MKTRQGFVSNSSSSSFVIGLKQKPTDYADLHLTLFKSLVSSKEFTPNWDKLGETSLKCTSQQIATTIYLQIKDQYSVSDDFLMNLCDNFKYNYKFTCYLPEIKELEKEALSKYNLSITNLPKNIPLRQEYERVYAKLDEENNKSYKLAQRNFWNKHSKKFNKLEKYIVISQTDSGEENKHGNILTIMDTEYKRIFKNIPYLKISSH